MVIRWGLVGCGWVARDYVVPGFLEAANAELVAACDVEPARAQAVAGPRGTSDFSRLLEADDVDAVYVATPNDSHRQLTEAAARAGKHVLCEKPMATSYTDSEAMVRACREAHVQYATAFDQRFQARHLLLRALIARGALGTVTSVRIHYACWLPGDWAEDNWRVDPVRAGGGAFVDLAPHGLDLVQMLLDEPIVDFHVLLQRRVHDYPVDDGAVAIGRTAAGALVTLHVAYNCRDAYPRRTLEILGTEARVEARDTMGQTSGGTLVLTRADGSTEILRPELDRSPFAVGIEAFSASLLTGTPFPFAPERDLLTARLLERGLARS